MTTTNTNTNTAKNESGGGFGNKIKGATQVIHGENIRGTALGAADRATSSVAGAQKNADAASKGRAEVAEGMARMKGRAPATQGAPAGTTPAGTAPPGTAPADQGTTAGIGTGTGTSAAAGVTGQGQQQGTSDEKTSAAREKSGPESTGPGAAQTGREAAVGAGAVHEQRGPDEVAAGTGAVDEQKQQYSSTASQQEGKCDERNVPERSQSGDTSQTHAQGTAEGRAQQSGERSSQQKVDEQRKVGVQQEGGQQGRWVGPGEGRCGHIRFQGISTDEGGEQSSQQMAGQESGQQAWGSQACAAQGEGHIRFQDFQGCGI
ncbi:hypothetical protein BDR05DRAFT_1062113 [Suillus weaverae]|nr:hypothetical protein BDR05DRAFT_1062113 [Suillus weaverae]